MWPRAKALGELEVRDRKPAPGGRQKTNDLLSFAPNGALRRRSTASQASRPGHTISPCRALMPMAAPPRGARMWPRAKALGELEVRDGSPPQAGDRKRMTYFLSPLTGLWVDGVSHPRPCGLGHITSPCRALMPMAAPPRGARMWPRAKALGELEVRDGSPPQAGDRKRMTYFLSPLTGLCFAPAAHPRPRGLGHTISPCRALMPMAAPPRGARMWPRGDSPGKAGRQVKASPPQAGDRKRMTYFLSPLTGLCFAPAAHPGLAAWATLFRPAGL